MAPPHETIKKGVSPWVKAFVALHVFCVTVWALPQPPEPVRSGKSPPQGTDWLLCWNAQFFKSSGLVRTYCSVSGFWQYWDMFAPNPAQIDYWGDADVIFKNGQKERFEYPRMFDLSIPAKYPMERYRKFYERAHSEDYKFLWPVFAQRIAVLSNNDPANPPVQVNLRRHWRNVAPPGKVQAVKYNEYEYFQYAVDPRSLKENSAR